jgi:phospholipid transport system transporter-binding protein
MRVEDGVAYPEGSMTLADAAGQLEAGCAAVAQGVGVFDLAAVGQLDSAALSLLLAWRRQAQARGLAFGIRNVPDSIHALAQLYGVDELIFA